MNVFAVTTGEYSDYRILGMFSTRRRAKKAQTFFGADNVENWALDTMPVYPKGKMPWYVQMERNGESNAQPTGIIETQYAVDEFEMGTKIYQRHTGDSEIAKGTHYMVTAVWATDKKHAVKIANERRIQILAENKWPE